METPRPAEDTTTLSAAQVDAVLARTFVFPNFSEITAFLTHLVRTMTEQQHHPDLSLNTGLKMVSVALTRTVSRDTLGVVHGRRNDPITAHSS
jgi:pterin-4a-carbinolamine dehydratase